MSSSAPEVFWFSSIKKRKSHSKVKRQNNASTEFIMEGVEGYKYWLTLALVIIKADRTGMGVNRYCVPKLQEENMELTSSVEK